LDDDDLFTDYDDDDDDDDRCVCDVCSVFVVTMINDDDTV
jgi:hypothetical protein